MVLPPAGNYVGKYAPFHPRVLRGTPWERAGLPYDVYALHGIWNGTAVGEVMKKSRPREDPRGRGFYFTIIRSAQFNKLILRLLSVMLRCTRIM